MQPLHTPSADIILGPVEVEAGIQPLLSHRCGLAKVVGEIDQLAFTLYQDGEFNLLGGCHG
ncbi:hypothetical protein D3C78_1979150 [compost metagenome]